jgi:chemotaxis protein CheY-P-specific phosphatase CheC
MLGGKVLYKQTRVFLQGSKEFADSQSIGRLATELSLKFNVTVEITIEFEKVTEKEKVENSLGLPSNKALPIVGPD